MLSKLTRGFFSHCCGASRKGWKNCLFPRAIPSEGMLLLVFAFIAARGNRGSSQQQWADQEAVAETKKSPSFPKAQWDSFIGVFYDFPNFAWLLAKANSPKLSSSTKQAENCKFSVWIADCWPFLHGSQHTSAPGWGIRKPCVLLTSCCLRSFSTLWRILILILENKS